MIKTHKIDIEEICADEAIPLNMIDFEANDHELCMALTLEAIEDCEDRYEVGFIDFDCM